MVNYKQGISDKDKVIHAIVNGDTNAIRVFLENGGDKNMVGCLNQPILFIAALYENLEIVRLLLENGADVNLGEMNGLTPLHTVAKNGNLDIVKLLLEKNADVNPSHTASFTSKPSPLYLAFDNGHLKIAELLLEKGADLNIMYWGKTPFYIALEKGHLDKVKLFLNNGADLGIYLDAHCYNPLALAIKNGQMDLVKLFLEKEPRLLNTSVNAFKESPLHIAVQSGYMEMVEFFVKKGAQLNALCFGNSTPLHSAASEGHLGIVQFLLDQGAELNIVANDFGWKGTPLDVAVERGHLDVVQLLLNRGAKKHHQEIVDPEDKEKVAPQNDEDKKDTQDSGCDRNLEKFNNLLTPLREKLLAREDDINYKAARIQAEAIITKLSSAAAIYYSKAPSEDSLNQFMSSCNMAFKPCDSDQIAAHRILFGAVFAAINHFFQALIKTIKGDKKSGIGFFDSRTDSKKIVDDVQENVDNSFIQYK